VQNNYSSVLKGSWFLKVASKENSFLKAVYPFRQLLGKYSQWRVYEPEFIGSHEVHRIHETKTLRRHDEREIQEIIQLLATTGFQ